MKKLSGQDIQRIRHMRQSGESINVIAKTVERSPATVSKYIGDIVLSDTVKADLLGRGAFLDVEPGLSIGS